MIGVLTNFQFTPLLSTVFAKNVLVKIVVVFFVLVSVFGIRHNSQNINLIHKEKIYDKIAYKKSLEVAFCNCEERRSYIQFYRNQITLAHAQ